MKNFSLVGIAGTLAFIAGCGGGGGTGKPVQLAAGERSEFKTSTGDTVHKEAARGFDDALHSFVAHDKAFDWNDGSCREVAGQFAKASDVQQSATHHAFASALYNSGLSYQRCGLDSDAQKQFQAAIDADRGFHRAAAQLALYEYQRSQNLDATIDKLNTIIRDAKFQNTDALVSVAALEMERQSSGNANQ